MPQHRGATVEVEEVRANFKQVSVLQAAKMVILLLGLSIKLSPLFHPYRGKRILSQEGNCILTMLTYCSDYIIKYVECHVIVT